MISNYYNLTKPGIIYGNCLAAIAGFFLASSHFDPKKFFGMLIGLALIIASACVLNNIHDANMDAKMDRTKNRAIPAGKISRTSAIIFACLLLVSGILAFALCTLHFSLLSALFGFFFYVFLYTPLKSKTTYATLIGAVAGATPPVVGYSAASGHFDLAALLLFLILFVWQMPHFYAIGIFRLKDYSSALVPILPVKSGFNKTRANIIFYIVVFLLIAPLLYIFKFTGLVYLVAVLLFSLYWLYISLKKVDAGTEAKWAKKLFFTSLLILTAWCAIIPLDKLISHIH